MKHDIFISYSRKDSVIVKRFADELFKAGYTYWMDIDGVESGDEFKKKITAAIRESKVFIFFSSVTSNKSEWTVKEVNYAIKKKIHIIPIKLDNADYDESVDFDLGAVDFIQCTTSKSIQEAVSKLLRSLKNKIDPSIKGDVIVDPPIPTPKKKDAILLNFIKSIIFRIKFSCVVSLLLLIFVGAGVWYGVINSKVLLRVVAINKNNGKIAYFTASEWENRSQVVDMNCVRIGVSIREDNKELIIAPTDCKDFVDDNYKYEFGCRGVDFIGVKEYYHISGFIATGYSDTKNIVEQAKGKVNSVGIEGAPAAETAWNYKTNSYDNLQWYLPSISELQMIYRNIDAINIFISRYIPNGSPICMDFLGFYWSSTERSSNSSWALNMWNGHSFNHDRGNRFRVRAVSVAKQQF